jgi:hypothetical protein
MIVTDYTDLAKYLKSVKSMNQKHFYQSKNEYKYKKDCLVKIMQQRDHSCS